jgi:hypothetical protein
MQPINTIPGFAEPAFIGTMPCQIVLAEIRGTVKIYSSIGLASQSQFKLAYNQN